MRKHYIDNLRWLCVLLLIPFHTCMIYNGFGENFYIKASAVPVLNDFIFVVSPWFMPLMFVLAGMSAFYALEKRTPGQFINERFRKLFIPLVAGILLIVPVQTYYAERFHNGYTGGYFEQYILFFTKPTNLSGYTGGFTPAHLWFILYLFIYSMALLPVFRRYRQSARQPLADKLPLPAILPLSLVASLLSPVLNFGGKSMGYYLAFFLLGYFILASDAVQQKLEKYRWGLFAAFVVLTIFRLTIGDTVYSYSQILFGLFYDFMAWLGILAFIGLGKRYLNISNKVTQYFAAGSFPIYIFHQTVLVAVAYYALGFTYSVPLQVACIIGGTFIITLAVYEVFRRISVTRFLFGIKNRQLVPRKEYKE